jgi:small multidrug resistance family-3 protein
VVARSGNCARGPGVCSVPYPAGHRRDWLACRSRHGALYPRAVTVARSIVLFVLAALAEIGGAWLVWQGVREHRGWVWVGAGVIALGLYGFVATLQPDPHFGRILAAYGGVFVAGSLLWGVVLDGFRPDRWDIIGALICLGGVAVIMYVPRPA